MIRWWVSYIVILGCFFNSPAQLLEARVSQSEILVGQPTTICYEVKIKKTDSILFTPKQGLIKAKSIKDFKNLTTVDFDLEITTSFQDTLTINGHSLTWIGKYTVTTWDSGMLIIPGQNITINDSTHVFPDLVLASYLPPPIEGLDIYDINEKYAELPLTSSSLIQFIKTNRWWFLIVLFSFILFLIFRKNKKDTPKQDKLIPTSLKNKTLIAIDLLEASKLWEKEELKEHFIGLSYILRTYLTSRYNISLLEKTTHETKIILAEKGLNTELVNLIIRTLSQSDMVKFAKSKPNIHLILNILSLSRQIIIETSPLESENV